jgi:hypothetical protein
VGLAGVLQGQSSRPIDTPVQHQVALGFFSGLGLVGIEKADFTINTAIRSALARSNPKAGAQVFVFTRYFREFSARVLRLSVAQVPVKRLRTGDEQKERGDYRHNQLGSHQVSPIVFGNV